MIDAKQLIGVMNLDDENDVLPPFHHKYLWNGRWRGTQGGGLRLESVPGNVLIPNYLLPTGTNQCIGAFYDQVNQAIIWFNYNSNGRNGIYKYNIKTKTVSKVFLCFTDSVTDILLFSLNYPIHSVQLVYRSDADGDLLFWVDGLNRPRNLNIATVTAIGQFTEGMITAAKIVPWDRPGATYANDSTVNSNNLRKKLFRFRYRWGYKNIGGCSTFSPISKVPLPIDGYTPDTQNDPTLNNNIEVVVNGGGNDYDYIEIYGQESQGDTWSDWFLIDTLGRTEYNITPGGAYTYKFYNDGVYSFIDPIETDINFSYLPDNATTLELLNGNVIVYGATTDGYPTLQRSEVDVTITTGVTNPNIPAISYLYTDASALVTQIGPTITVGATYHIALDYISGGSPGSISVNYTTILGSTADSIATALAALLNSGNVQAVFGGSGTIRITIIGVAPSFTNVVMTVSVSGSESAGAAWPWASPQRFGIQYLDDWGKPIGGVVSYVSASAIDTTDFAVTTQDFSTASTVPQVPFIAASINHLPPQNATNFQWVRASLTPKFVQWVSNDYQTDTDFLYVCYQNLLYQDQKSSGFVPTYDFAKGDRVKIMASYSGGTLTPYNIQLDFEILGVVDRTMTSPAITGKFLKLAKPATLPSGGYSANMFMQMYTPLARIADDVQVFYEWGQVYRLHTIAGVKYHEGQLQSQTATLPATFQWFDGDVYYKNRGFYLNVNATTTNTLFMMDKNYSDYFPSAVNSNGRGWVIDQQSATIFNGVKLKWGEKYLQDTNINQLNIFYPTNEDVIDLSGGDIKRLVVLGREINIIQARKIGRMSVYGKYIQDSGGNNILTTTDNIITPNNISYHPGEYGCGDQPCGVVKGVNDIYINDPVRGLQLRLSGDGITEISTLYKGQYYIKNLLVKYNKDYLRGDGSKSKVIAYYDFFENQFGSILQEGTVSGNTISNNNFSFNEPRNAYCSFYGWFGEWALGAEDLMYSWKNGQLYVHNNETDWCKFYNIQDYPSVTLVFNKDAPIKKVFNAISYQCNQKWVSDTDGDINTSMINPQTELRQISQLKAVDYEPQENIMYGAFWRDANSGSNPEIALLEGDFLNGVWIECKMTYKGSKFAYMFSPYVNYQVSPRNF